MQCKRELLVLGATYVGRNGTKRRITALAGRADGNEVFWESADGRVRTRVGRCWWATFLGWAKERVDVEVR